MHHGLLYLPCLKKTKLNILNTNCPILTCVQSSLLAFCLWFLYTCYMSHYLSDTIQEFLEYLDIEQNRSQKTIENYHHYLMRLVEFAGDPEIKDVKPETIRKWRLWLNRLSDESTGQISVTTQNYHLIALRSFLKFCSNHLRNRRF